MRRVPTLLYSTGGIATPLPFSLPPQGAECCGTYEMAPVLTVYLPTLPCPVVFNFHLISILFSPCFSPGRWTMACLWKAGAGKQEWGTLYSAVPPAPQHVLRRYSYLRVLYLCALLLSSSLGASTPLRPPCAPSVPNMHSPLQVVCADWFPSRCLCNVVCGVPINSDRNPDGTVNLIRSGE